MDSLKPKLRCGVAALAMMACCGGVAAADDDLPGLDEAAAEGGVKTGGVVQFDLARTYGGKVKPSNLVQVGFNRNDALVAGV